MAGPLTILHVLRAPVGGLFRHVLDVAQGQAELGHKVGIVAAQTDNPQADAKLGALAPQLALGVSRIPMQRQVGLGDAAAVRHVGRVIAATAPNVVHGHGAKGGAFARLAPCPGIRVYTPHGGSLHYGRWTPQGMFYGAAEHFLMRRTNLLLFESNFARQTYENTIGKPRCIVRVVHNGVGPAEFDPVRPVSQPSDLVTIGELRHLKGIDVLIEAVGTLARSGRKVTATIVGEGPDAQKYRDMVGQRGLDQEINFAGYLPARQAFGLGRLLIVASRAESLPYVVLEAAAAELPMVSTNVGGIPEIFGSANALIPPGNPAALASAIASALDSPDATRAGAQALRARVRGTFSQAAMVEGILAAYREAIAINFHRSH